MIAPDTASSSSSSSSSRDGVLTTKKKGFKVEKEITSSASPTTTTTTTTENLNAVFNPCELDVTYDDESETYNIINKEGRVCLELSINIASSSSSSGDDDSSLKSIDLLHLYKCGAFYGRGSNLLLLLKTYAKEHEFDEINLQDAAYKSVNISLSESGSHNNSYEYSLSTLFLLSTGGSYYGHFGFFHNCIDNKDHSIRVKETINQNVALFFNKVINKLYYKKHSLFPSLIQSLSSREGFHTYRRQLQKLHDDDIEASKTWYRIQFDKHVSPWNEQHMTVKQYFSRVFMILYQKQACDNDARPQQLIFILFFIHTIWFSNILEHDHSCELTWSNPHAVKGKGSSSSSKETEIGEKTLDVWEIVCSSERCRQMDPTHTMPSRFNKKGHCIACDAPRSYRRVKLFPEQQPSVNSSSSFCKSSSSSMSDDNSNSITADTTTLVLRNEPDIQTPASGRKKTFGEEVGEEEAGIILLARPSSGRKRLKDHPPSSSDRKILKEDHHPPSSGRKRLQVQKKEETDLGGRGRRGPRKTRRRRRSASRQRSKNTHTHTHNGDRTG